MPIAERAMSKELGVSRTPIKYALNRLEREGLVRIIERKGVFPIEPSYLEYQRILEIREMLEGLASRLAVDHVSNAKVRELEQIFDNLGDISDIEKMPYEDYAKVNVDFHHEILHLSNNPKLIEMVEGLYDHLSLVRLRTLDIPGRRSKSLAEHRKILKALQQRDNTLAEKAMRDHIRAVLEDIQEKPEE